MRTVHVLYYNDPPNPLMILGVFDNATEAGYAKQTVFNELQKTYKRKFDEIYDNLKADRADGYIMRVQLVRERESDRVIEFGKALDIIEVPMNDFLLVEKLPEF